MTYSYDTENRLVSASGGTVASLLYDPLGRLVRVHDGNAANARWIVYDGDALAWFDGSSTAVANRHDMFANVQGSIIGGLCRGREAFELA